jgi:hypothetical protein
MVFLLLLRRFDDRPDADQPRIEPLGHPLDHPPLARGVRPLKNQNQIFRTFLEKSLGMEELELKGTELVPVIGFFMDLLVQIQSV